MKNAGVRRHDFTNSLIDYEYNRTITNREPNKERAPKRVMDKYTLQQQLHSLRLKLHEIAEARGSLTDPDVLAISEEADQLIVELQHMQKEELAYSSDRRHNR